METRASYTLVGAFVLALVAALAVFTVYLAKVQFDQAMQPYFIYTTGSVTGLVEGSPVRYRGVAVGTVSDIRIDPQNVERIRITIEVPEETPVKADAVASLEPMGVTGGVYVEITGGSQAAPLLRDQADGTPEIPSRQSALSSVLERTPDMLVRVIDAAQRVSQLLNEQNQESIQTLLANMAQASVGANDTIRNANLLVVDLRGQVNQLSGQANTLLKTANSTLNKVGNDAGTISGDLAQTTRELNRLTQSLTRTSNELEGLIAENREPIRDFTSTGLYDFGQLLVHLQDLTANLARVTNKLERDPSELLFGGKSGVDVK
ncbi:MlaD family protein [Oleisolibacter albus]|uniref:MlaD family protein n=1 Tax=Oleisolibacter albus TaxID=2171757 RepID=UPI000DF1F01D|nr:MlaD family protein [Oleisolibacter albus]